MDNTERIPERRHERGFFWPVLLIGIGVLLLLSNLGVLPANYWSVAWRLWPLLLVALGLLIVVGERSAFGRAFGAVLALAVVAILAGAAVVAENDPTLFGAPTLQTYQVEHPADGIRQATVTIDFPGGEGTVSAPGQSSRLIEGEVTTFGELINEFSVNGDTARVNLDRRFSFSGPAFFNTGREKWTLGLNRNVAYDLDLDGGSGSYNFDLRGVDLRSLKIDSGSGAMSVTLPEQGQYYFELDAGSGAIDISVPDGVAVRVEYDAGSGGFNAPKLTRVSGDRGDGMFETPGFSQSGSYVIIVLDGGSGAVAIR